MKYAVGTGSVVVLYIPSFIKIRSGIKRLIAGVRGFIHMQTAWRKHKLTFIWSK
jgi:hypothetical protein